MTRLASNKPRPQAHCPLDYAEVLRRLLPQQTIAGPVYDPINFLREHFGEPDCTTVSPLVSEFVFQKGEAGLRVRIEAASARVLAITPFGFGWPFMWKTCKQARWSGVWITGTGSTSYTPIIGSFAGACAAAAGLAVLDYAAQVAAQEPALCQGLCTAPCWCTLDPKFPTRNTTITTKWSLFGIPVSFTVTITLSGWVLASCEGWNF